MNIFQKTDFIAFGRALKPHGIKGLVRMSLADFDADALFEQDAFMFFDIEGTYVPFALESLEWLNDTDALIKIEDINDNNEADFFSGKTAWLLKKDAERAGLKAGNDSLKGYKLIDDKAGSFGEITNIDDSTANIIVMTDSGHTLPIHDDFITTIDDDKQIVLTHFPDEIIEWSKEK